VKKDTLELVQEAIEDVVGNSDKELKLCDSIEEQLEVNFKDACNLDSLDDIEFVMSLETAFDDVGDIPDKVYDEFNTIKDVVDYIDEKIKRCK